MMLTGAAEPFIIGKMLAVTLFCDLDSITTDIAEGRVGRATEGCPQSLQPKYDERVRALNCMSRATKQMAQWDTALKARVHLVGSTSGQLSGDGLLG